MEKFIELGNTMISIHATYRAFLISVKHLHLELAYGLASLLYGTANLGQEIDGRGLCLCKDINVIRSHPLLCNKDFFRAINDKVPSRIVRTLVKVVQVLVLQIT